MNDATEDDKCFLFMIPFRHLCAFCIGNLTYIHSTVNIKNAKRLELKDKLNYNKICHF